MNAIPVATAEERRTSIRCGNAVYAHRWYKFATTTAAFVNMYQRQPTEIEREVMRLHLAVDSQPGDNLG